MFGEALVFEINTENFLSEYSDITSNTNRFWSME